MTQSLQNPSIYAEAATDSGVNWNRHVSMLHLKSSNVHRVASEFFRKVQQFYSPVSLDWGVSNTGCSCQSCHPLSSSRCFLRS